MNSLCPAVLVLCVRKVQLDKRAVDAVVRNTVDPAVETNVLSMDVNVPAELMLAPCAREDAWRLITVFISGAMEEMSWMVFKRRAHIVISLILVHVGVGQRCR